MNQRIEKIQAMLKDEPEDSFLRYTLAMEYRKLQRRDLAEPLFRGLMQDAPPHVPAFFMGAQMDAEHGDIEAARTTLRAGIDEARRQGNSHAAAEMSEMLASLGVHGEGGPRVTGGEAPSAVDDEDDL